MSIPTGIQLRNIKFSHPHVFPQADPNAFMYTGVYPYQDASTGNVHMYAPGYSNAHQAPGSSNQFQVIKHQTMILILAQFFKPNFPILEMHFQTIRAQIFKVDIIVGSFYAFCEFILFTIDVGG